MPSQEPLWGGERVSKAKPELSLKDALIQKITGRKAGFAERLAKRSPQDQAAWVAKQHKGDAAAAAKSAGVSARTFKDWITGKRKPSKASKDKLDQATRAAMVPKGRRDRIAKSSKGAPKRGGPTKGVPVSKGPGLRPKPPKGGASLTAWVKVSNDDRSRVLDLGGNLPEGRLSALVRAYEEGGEDALNKEMEAIIREYLGGYSGYLEIGGIDSLTFDPMDDPPAA